MVLTMKQSMTWKRLLATACLALTMIVGVAGDIWAASLDNAKAIGLIGERPDGYVGAVQPNPPPDIAALVEQVNNKRRSAYEDIAAKEGVPIDQVGALAAEKIRAQAPTGNYFLTQGGTWAQK
jgi:uncharacterized protein YdbL (DUF1318 family)